MNNQKYCQWCAQPYTAGHARVCVMRPNNNPNGGNQNPPSYSLSNPVSQQTGQVTRAQYDTLLRQFNELNNAILRMNLANRLSALETRQVQAPVGRASMFVRHPRAPALTENRVFTVPLGTVTCAPTTTWVSAGSVTVDRNMVGFSAWARGYSRISVSAVCVTYTDNYTGPGSAVVLFGLSPDSDLEPNGTAVLSYNHRVLTNFSRPDELYYEFPENSPFKRVIVGTVEGDDRPLIRAHLFRSARQFFRFDGGNVANIDIGFAHLMVQCACTRAPMT